MNISDLTENPSADLACPEADEGADEAAHADAGTARSSGQPWPTDTPPIRDWDTEVISELWT